MLPLMYMPSTVYVWIGSSLLWKVQFVFKYFTRQTEKLTSQTESPIKLHTYITAKMTYHNIMPLIVSSILWILQFYPNLSNDLIIV